jgi:hypothetical protein
MVAPKVSRNLISVGQEVSLSFNCDHRLHLSYIAIHQKLDGLHHCPRVFTVVKCPRLAGMVIVHQRLRGETDELFESPVAAKNGEKRGFSVSTFIR